MEVTPPQWVAPDEPARDSPSQQPTAHRFNASAPLGGAAPTPTEELRPSMARDMTVAAALLVASILVGFATLMSWRDYGPGLDPDESGWRYADGSFGRGWVAIVLAICLAVGGVLLVSGRRTAGRRWARVGSGALIVLPILEWTFGDTGSRSGPGLGLWVLMAAGVILMVLLGTVLPSGESKSQPDPSLQP
ncbi:MAG: hypothetical protein ACR2N9_04970 [Acidimicrobiia bacterium]